MCSLLKYLHCVKRSRDYLASKPSCIKCEKLSILPNLSTIWKISDRNYIGIYTYLTCSYRDYFSATNWKWKHIWNLTVHITVCQYVYVDMEEDSLTWGQFRGLLKLFIPPYLHFELPFLLVIPLRWKDTSVCEGISCIYRLHCCVVCGFLMLNSQPVHTILLHLDSWHINSLLSALFQQSHEWYSQELTCSKICPGRANQIWIICWGLMDQKYLLYWKR